MKTWSLIAVPATTTAAPAFAQETLRVGLTGALTGPVAGTYAPAVEGLRLYVERLNEGGGIDGQNVDLIL